MKKLFFLISLLLNSVNLFSQQNPKEYTNLPNSTISNIVKDNNGFYWILTIDGFFRWNGKKFFQNEILINEKYLESIMKTKKLLIETSFDLKKNTLIDFSSKNYSTNNTKIFNSFLFFDSKLLKKKIRLFNNGKLYNNEYEKLTQLKKLYSLLDSNKQKVALNYVDTSNGYILQTKKGYYFLETNPARRVLCYISNEGHFKKMNSPKMENGIFLVLNDTLIQYDPYFGFYSFYINDKWTRKRYTSFKLIQKKQSWKWVQIDTKESYITNNYEILKISIKKNNVVIEKILNHEDYKGLICFFADKAKNKLLIASTKRGFSVLSAKSNIKILPALGNSNSYNHAIINGKIISNTDIYIKFFYKDYGQFEWYLNSTIIPIENNKILYGADLYFYEFDGLKVKKSSAKFDAGINSYVKTDSIIYITNKELYCYSNKSKTITKTNKNAWPTEGGILWYIHPSPKPNCILACIDDKFVEINFLNKTKTILGKGIEGEVRNIYYDSLHSTYFISTRFDGCYIVKPNIFIKKLPFTYAEKEFNSHYVLQDKEGDFWLPSNIGLFLMLKKDFENYLIKGNSTIPFRKFGKEDGILNEEFNGGFQGSGLYYKDTMYMANMAGTVVFSPNIKYAEKKDEGILVIDYVKVDSSFFYNNYNNLTIPPTYKQISIKADYPFINITGNLQYQVTRIQDTTWYNLNEDGIIEFKNLSAGNYTVKIRTTSNINKIIQLNFNIQPFWYNTWWAKIFFALLIAFSAFIIFSWRIKTIKNNNLDKINKARNQFFLTIAHDLKGPINNFISISEIIKSLIKERNFEMIDMISNELDSKANNLRLLIENILNWSLLVQQFNKVTKAPFLIEDILNEIIPAYKDLALNNEIGINIKNEVNTTIVTDKNIVSLIFRNLIDNAVKKAVKKSEVSIKLTMENKKLILTVANKFDEKAENKVTLINKMFNDNKIWEPYSEGLGLGLIMTKRSVDTLNGFAMCKHENNLMSFIITIPMN